MTASPRGVLFLLVAVVCFGLVFILGGVPWVGQAVCVAGGLLFLSCCCARAPRALVVVGSLLVYFCVWLWGFYSIIYFSAPAFVGLSAPRAPV